MTICGEIQTQKKPEYTMIKVISKRCLVFNTKVWRYEPTNSQIQDWSKCFKSFRDSRNKNAPCPKIYLDTLLNLKIFVITFN